MCVPIFVTLYIKKRMEFWNFGVNCLFFFLGGSRSATAEEASAAAEEASAAAEEASAAAEEASAAAAETSAAAEEANTAAEEAAYIYKRCVQLPSPHHL